MLLTMMAAPSTMMGVAMKIESLPCVALSPFLCCFLLLLLLIKTVLHTQVHNKYNSRNLVDFSASMTDVSLYLSPGRSGGNSGRWSSASSAGGSGNRPRSAPFRKTRPRTASGAGTPGTGTPRSRPVTSQFSPSPSASLSMASGGQPRKGSNSKQRPGSARASPGGRKARESKKYASISRSALEEPSWDGYSERNDKTSTGGMT